VTALREAAQQAEDVLRGCLEHPDAADAIAALQAALAEPDAPQPKAEQRPPNCGTGFCSCIECPYVQPKAEQEPVCEVANVLGNMVTALCEGVPPAPGDKLYAAPQPRKRLTDQEIDAVWDTVPQTQFWWRRYARAIEAAVWGEQHGS
jgi:pyruvate/2-oxoglutarate dehydrogenase complex dihydrolipoamide acyltransferase (E2) component